MSMRSLATGETRPPWRAASSDIRYEEYVFEGGPYLGFPKSHDVWADGSIVVVPARGHTPGSVIIFVNLPTKKRYAFLGDLGVADRRHHRGREESSRG